MVNQFNNMNEIPIFFIGLINNKLDIKIEIYLEKRIYINLIKSLMRNLLVYLTFEIVQSY